jgi:predicted short-subunit dehydrogenase-like oxidoreductase (DUF2520 family)
MQTLNLIGAGRVGQTLARLWQTHGVFALQDVLTNAPATAQAACSFIGAGTPVTKTVEMRPANVWMLAVPDAQIAAVAAALAAHLQTATGPAPIQATHSATRARAPAELATAAVPLGADTPTPPAHQTSIVFHCSGAQSSRLLSPLANLGWQTASAHCILSFADRAAAVQQFRGTACALEGDARARAVLHAGFTAIQARCFEVQGSDKLLYHAAAVFATNFLPVLQNVAEDAWRASGVPADLLPGLRAALLNNAVANITRLGPAGALTGPAARGDVAAIAAQAAAVTQWDAQAGAAYEALSALALRLAKATSATSATPATSH